MNYANIIYCDIANGLGCRTSLFVSGCRHHCKNCFNKVTWNFNYGKPYTEQTKNKILESIDKPYIQGLTILGGEPFEPENQEYVLDLVTTVKKLYSDKDIWIYSGYTFEQLKGEMCEKFKHMTTDISINNCRKILEQTDILVDGEFIQELHDISLKYRGSKNQRIIDVKKTLATDILSEKKL